MSKMKRFFSLKMMQRILGAFLIVSIIVFIGIGNFIQRQDLNETYRLAEETASFIQAECEKFDNYTRGNSAYSLQQLLDTATGLKKYIPVSELTDSEFLQDFILTEHVGGIIVLDHALNVLAQADMDHQEAYALWQTTISKSNLSDILRHPEETYIDHITINEIAYDYAVVASDDGEVLLLCYSSTDKPSYDPFELTMKGILTNNSFFKNPTLVITDGTQVLSTNNLRIEEQGIEQYQRLVSDIDWKENQLTKFRYSNTTYYGLRRVYNNYFIYTVYATDDMFTNQIGFLFFGFSVYMLIAIVILAAQRHFDKISMNKMEKQLRIINAISTAYDSTFLLYTDKIKLEPVRPSERLNAVFEKKPNPYDFLMEVCKNEIAEEYHPAVMHFLDMDTIAERLKGKTFLGCEVKDRHGTWFSILLIPQKYDAEGNVQAVLITTRDITSVKQTEELTYKDQLTGLYNRNYMESRSKNFVSSEELPVSLIMVDCNYLKRTNDNLGHEYGDLLLQRIANVIEETIPDNFIAMRVGGDEFLILGTHCTKEMAQRTVADMKQRLVAKSDNMMTLSAAFGISTTEGGEFNFEQAYGEADQEMYRDKKASRIER